MTLLALMVAILYGAFFLGHRAAEKARVRFDKSQTLRSVGEYLGTLIRSAYPYQSSGEGAVPFSGEKEQLSFVSAVSMGVEGRGVSKISLSWSGAGGDVTLVEETPVCVVPSQQIENVEKVEAGWKEYWESEPSVTGFLSHNRHGGIQSQGI